ncbi:cyclic pyranopterin monophosphate synthase MoaC, partial [Acinetobacter baumannii]
MKLSKETIEVLQKTENPKGNPLEIARIAGIMAAKRTAELIPLCHSINLGHLGITVDLTDDGVEIRAEASTNAQTGVEMEAM